MKNGIGLILTFATYLGIFLLIPIGIILVAGIIKYNQKIKTVIMCLFSCIYNLIFGLLDVAVYFMIGITFLGAGNTDILVGVADIIIYLLFFIPINIFMQKKGKIEPYIYLAIMLVPKLFAIMINHNLNL